MLMVLVKSFIWLIMLSLSRVSVVQVDDSEQAVARNWVLLCLYLRVNNRWGKTCNKDDRDRTGDVVIHGRPPVILHIWRVLCPVIHNSGIQFIALQFDYFTCDMGDMCHHVIHINIRKISLYCDNDFRHIVSQPCTRVRTLGRIHKTPNDGCIF